MIGKVVVITGGARGIGRAYTHAFLEAGALVVATDRSWEGVEPLDPARTANGKNVLVADMDVTNDEAIDRVFAATMERFGTVDALINNAALRQRELFPPTGRTTTLGTTDADWLKSFGVNVFGALKVTRRFIRPMIAQHRGSIVSIVSSGILNFSHGGAYTALRPNSQEMPYQASKAALATMSFYLADEVRKDNVAVNVIIPGHTRTTGFDEQNLARMALGTMRVGPLPLVPEHMVPLTLHLAAQDASTITGKMFDVEVWNQEHGLGGHERWADTSFSYEALQEQLKKSS
ncbi:MAG TPA: SDR family oxidoreductase [Candidatus Lustribacter sp.]|nr:SDR family oxidoreductase [Candidatus Lustribacter sp.]